jgi:hypothetical protein
MRTTPAAVASGVVAAIIPVAAAAVKVALDHGFEGRDLKPFTVWSGLFGLLMMAVSWLVVEITLDVRQPARYVVAAVVGPLTALAFTMFVLAVLGPWIGGFGFPILAFWALGGVAALWLAVRWTRDVRA